MNAKTNHIENLLIFTMIIEYPSRNLENIILTDLIKVFFTIERIINLFNIFLNNNFMKKSTD